MRRASFWRRVMGYLGTYGDAGLVLADAYIAARGRVLVLRVDAPADDVPAQH